MRGTISSDADKGMRKHLASSSVSTMPSCRRLAFHYLPLPTTPNQMRLLRYRSFRTKELHLLTSLRKLLSVARYPQCSMPYVTLCSNSSLSHTRLAWRAVIAFFANPGLVSIELGFEMHLREGRAFCGLVGRELAVA